MILALAVLQSLKVHQIDVETAFLNSDRVEEIYVTMAPGYETSGCVWRLLKALYWMKQSPRVWNTDIEKYLKPIGLVVLKG